MNEIEKAIAYFEYRLKDAERNGYSTRGEITAAITALREKAEREKGCEYCATPDCETCIHDGSYEYCACVCRQESHYEPINFCPMCGRKL